MSQVTNRVVSTKEWTSGGFSPWEIVAGVAVAYVLLRGFNANAQVTDGAGNVVASGGLEYGAPGIPGIPGIPGY
ncbi:MAG: hypothetical protein OSA97_01440 [Nevskia sp.]|nr:hypothetical protein [Nevskia sp.]